MMDRILAASLLGAIIAVPRPLQADTLAQRLGFPPDARVLILNGDDAGMCHSANQGTIEAIEHGVMSSATVMVPCPWFGAMADYARRSSATNLGIHLVHTSEWRHYRWGPVASSDLVASLLDPDGYLWASVEQVYAHGTPDHALIEGRAQIRKALAAGIDVTHLDSHMGTLQLDVRFVEIYLRLAVEFDLPVRMASQSTLAGFNQAGMRSRFANAGIVFPDFFVYEELKDEAGDVKGFWTRIVKGLPPGVTELFVHAAKPTEELRAITGTWRTRGEQYELLARDAGFRELLDQEGIVRISYRPLRDLQRKLRKNREPQVSTP
ncbi:MAG: polysaccharide deacetylase family protein [Limisphaerales bacterium]